MFEKHILVVTEREGYSKHTLKLPDSNYCEILHFINVDGSLIVKGDYGNWIFCRSFIPSAGKSVSEEYWIEKLEMHSTQKGYVYSFEETTERINERIRELEEENKRGHKGEIQFLESLLIYADDKVTFESELWSGYSEFMDGEDASYLVGERVNPRLKIVFAAFDEICRRLSCDTLSD